jgi:hypothetical protein
MVAADRGECCEAAGPCCASRHCRGEAFIRNGKRTRGGMVWPQPRGWEGNKRSR